MTSLISIRVKGGELTKGLGESVQKLGRRLILFLKEFLDLLKINNLAGCLLEANYKAGGELIPGLETLVGIVIPARVLMRNYLGAQGKGGICSVSFISMSLSCLPDSKTLFRQQGIS